ncbi:SDR family oxidoreductase [Pseudomonas sp. CCI1.2]|uniref:SDR family NAD(P)-dependent oxidoreductase n=1 Tax=Pseudomonas sp. CCI1.2 TaxID=3048614 RepID=UPI002B22DF96|nr:SDR family oxidoreductase [Pseudomonas sp. CCI1.2]MEB0122122.1 SDR family oxidoreductase [Pseudomonas sp. CCI1.2]
MTTQPNHSKKGTALITGASTGIGAIYADRLAKRGYDLILVARQQARLDAVATGIRSESGREVAVVVADLNVAADVRRVEAILSSDANITLLVNNAGVGATSSVLESDADKMDAMIGLNITSLARLAGAAARGFAARGTGALINIASIVAVAPEILNGVYGGSKAFVLAFSQSLHHELKDKGVQVQVVLPGATRTEFWDVAGLPAEHLPQNIVMDAQDMVDAALAGFDQGELVTIPSLPNAADWQAYEDARQHLVPNLSLSEPAPRFNVDRAGRN